MQSCSRGSGQHFTGKNPVQCCFNTPGTKLHRSKPYKILSERLQIALQRKCPVQGCLNTPGTTLHRKKIQAMYYIYIYIYIYTHDIRSFTLKKIESNPCFTMEIG